MPGNFLKSDVLPVARPGYRASHLPDHATRMPKQVSAQELAGVQLEAVAPLVQVPLLP